MINAIALERDQKRRGMITSFVIHLLLLLIIFFYAFPEKQDIKQYPPPIVVDFSYAPSSLSKYARAEEGKSRPKTKEVPKVVTAKPQPVVKPKPKLPTPIKPKQPDPEPTDPVVTDAVVDEAPIEAVEEPIEVEEPDQEVLTEEDLAELEEEAQEEEPETVEIPTTNSTTEETTTEETTQGSVTEGEEGGTGKGDEGTGPGKSGGNDADEGEGDAGAGTGEYDDSGNGIFGRKVIYQNWREAIKNLNNINGVIVMKFCVNRSGEVTYVEIIPDETTETDRKVLKQVARGMYGYKVEPDPSGPKEECGKYKFKLDINALRGN